jgi:hypothetical protein
MGLIGAVNSGRIADWGRGHQCAGIIPVVPVIADTVSGLSSGSSFPVVLDFLLPFWPL